MRKVRGRDVRITHGLAESLAQLEREPPEFREEVAAFIDGLISHYVLDEGRLVVAHAGLSEALQGRGSGKVRDFALYGETTGETDEFGLPIARDDFSFELLIIGYQFPHLAEAEYDSNWLNLKIVVRHPKGDWSAADPAMLTYEVRELADWLRTVGAGRREIREMAFLEPCLSLKVRSGDDSSDELEIVLAHEFRPPWASDIDQTAAISFR